MVVVEERAQCFSWVAYAVLELIEPRVDVAVQVVEEFTGTRQRWPGLGRAVEIPGETIALGACMSVVQVCRDLRSAEPLVVRRELVMDAHDDRLAVSREQHRAWCRRLRAIALEAPYGLPRVGLIEQPLGVFPRGQLVGECERQLVPALVWGSSCLTCRDVGLFGGRWGEDHRFERRYLRRKLQRPGDSGWAGRDDRAEVLVVVLVLAGRALRGGHQRRGKCHRGEFEEGSAACCAANRMRCSQRAAHGASLPPVESLWFRGLATFFVLRGRQDLMP
ncbi:hypothetical protein D9M71_166840 [compost metagenome]